MFFPALIAIKKKRFILFSTLILFLFFSVSSFYNVAYAEGTNFLTNGSFESGVGSPWYLVTTSPANGSVAVTNTTSTDGSNSAKITISNTSSSSWKVQFRQDSVSLSAGTTYTLSFWAKASSSRAIDYVLQGVNSPYTVYVDQSANLSTTWQKYTYRYTSTATDSAFFGLNVAKNKGTVYVDNVSVTKSIAAPSGYSSLIFDDTFPGTSLDSTKWIPQIADQYGIWNNNGSLTYPLSGITSGGYDAEYFDPLQVSLANNILSLNANTSAAQSGYTWKSGVISTHGLFTFTGGYAQFSAKMPDSSTGMWGGIWFLEGGAEIDLAETGYTGHGTVNQVISSNLHSPGNNQQFYDSGVDLSAGYHVYGMKYIPGTSVTMYLDGVQIAQYTSNIPTGAMTILVDLQAAQNTSGWHTMVSGFTPSPSTMHVSEVQVWQ